MSMSQSQMSTLSKGGKLANKYIGLRLTVLLALVVPVVPLLITFHEQILASEQECLTILLGALLIVSLAAVYAFVTLRRINPSIVSALGALEQIVGSDLMCRCWLTPTTRSAT